MKTNKILYWVATGLLSLLMVFSATMYFVNTAEVSEVFVALGYNTRIVIPLAVLKLLGVGALLSNYSKPLKEWAYFGFLLDFVLALEAHVSAGDDEESGAILALALWLVSYVFHRKLFA